MWQKQEARDAFSLSLHVNRHDMGRERDGRSNSSYSFLLNETALPLPRFLDVEAWLAIRQTWSEFGDRHRSRSRTWFREREREREREILRDEQTKRQVTLQEIEEEGRSNRARHAYKQNLFAFRSWLVSWICYGIGKRLISALAEKLNTREEILGRNIWKKRSAKNWKPKFFLE